MSRSNLSGERPTNPALRFFSWNGAEGHFLYYNKEAVNPAKPDKKGMNIKVSLPFAFLVLDQLTTIKGWSDADQSGIWSNEIRDLKKEILNIRTKKGLEISGTYEHVKGRVTGADYSKSVYVAFYDENKALQIGNIQMGGAALNSWIEFCKGKNVNEGAIRVENFTEAQKGAVKYKMPNFIAFPCKPETNSTAVELDKRLQEYLKEYFAYNSTVQEEVKSEPKAEESFVQTTRSTIQTDDDFIPKSSMPEQSAKEIIAAKKAVVDPVQDIYNDLPDGF